MKTSPNGALLMSGAGLRDAQQRIQAAFEQVRVLNTWDVADEISIDTVEIDALQVVGNFQLAEGLTEEFADVDIIDLDAELDAQTCMQHAIKHHEDLAPHVRGGSFTEQAFDVEEPNESVAQLFAAALRDLGETGLAADVTEAI